MNPSQDRNAPTRTSFDTRKGLTSERDRQIKTRRGVNWGRGGMGEGVGAGEGQEVRGA